jgi:hypothetical protein
LGLEELFSTRAIEQNLVAIGFPDGGELCGPRAMEAKIDPAGFIASQQNSFRHPIGPGLELVVITNGFVDVFSKIVNAFNLLKTSQHYWQVSPVGARRPASYTAPRKWGNVGVSADREAIGNLRRQTHLSISGVFGDLAVLSSSLTSH